MKKKVLLLFVVLAIFIIGAVRFLNSHGGNIVVNYDSDTESLVLENTTSLPIIFVLNDNLVQITDVVRTKHTYATKAGFNSILIFGNHIYYLDQDVHTSNSLTWGEIIFGRYK